MTNEQFNRILNEIEARIGEGETFELKVQTLGPYFYRGAWVREPHNLLHIKDRHAGEVWVNMEMIVTIGLGDPL